MATDTVKPDQPQSYFARKLAADPALAARCEAVVRELRAAAAEEIAACERSSQIGPKDLRVYINT